MGNLKYNPLLKLNLQEETDASEIIGDGYNEKLLTWEDFVNDCQTIINDNGELRKYQLTSTVYNNKTLTCNFSFVFFCNNYQIYTFPKININAKKTIFFNAFFFNSSAAYPFSYSNCQTVKFINSKISPFIGMYSNTQCTFFFSNCEWWANATVSDNPTSLQTFILLNCFSRNNNIINFTFAHPDKYSIIINNNNNKYFTDNKLDFANFICIDSALDATSPGLVPNNVLSAKFAELTPDATLDADSNKPVMNSAVTTQINNITQIIENFQDINVRNLQEFNDAIAVGQTANVRIHLTTDITLTQSVTYNLDKIEIYGHDNKINLENFTFTIAGATCNFYQVRFNANSAVTASSAANYSNAQIIIKASEASTRYFFEYVIFMNFICQISDNLRNIINISANSGLSSPSAHLYFMFCEVMTKYMISNINNCVAGIYHSGSENGQIKFHALTAHNIDFWGNSLEANSCGNWSFTGNTLTGLAKLGWISDGSSTYKIVTNSLTPSFVNQYNPSYNEFLTLKNNLYTKYNYSNTNSTFDINVELYLINKLAYINVNINIKASFTTGISFIQLTDFTFVGSNFVYFPTVSYNGSQYFQFNCYFQPATGYISHAGSWSDTGNFNGFFIVEIQ